MVTVYFVGMLENYNWNQRSWPIQAESFQVFAGDGTPLGDYFEGYDLVIVDDEDREYIDIRLDVADKNYSESRNKAMCDEVRACEPYMVYTASDGSTLTIPLLQGE